MVANPTSRELRGNLRAYRTKSGLTSEELGKLLGYSGSAVRKMEQASDSNLSSQAYLAYISALGLKLIIAETAIESIRDFSKLFLLPLVGSTISDYCNQLGIHRSVYYQITRDEEVSMDVIIHICNRLSWKISLHHG
jgi:DNA-binding XRE family transcriptional regulator